MYNNNNLNRTGYTNMQQGGINPTQGYFVSNYPQALPMGMQMNPNQMMGGANNLNNTINQFGLSKEAQIQELKTRYPDTVYRPNPNQPYEFIEFTLQLDNGSLKIPLALLIDSQYPATTPKIFVRARFKHRFIEIGNHGPEILISNFFNWTKTSTLVQLVNTLKSTLEADPPKQEKIIEDVNNMLSKIGPDDFKELVNPDWLNTKTQNELKQYASNPNFEDIIVTSKQYKKIANNILECAAFNEKLANELIQKHEILVNAKQQLNAYVQRIQTLTEELAMKQEKCKKYADRFSKANMEKSIKEEIDKLDNLSDELGQNLSISNIPYGTKLTSTGNNIDDSLNLYFETRKKYHYLCILKERLSTVQP